MDAKAKTDDAKIDRILDFWFGHVEQTIIPSQEQVRIWFGEEPSIDAEIRKDFRFDLDKAIAGEFHSWRQSARGQLALIILLDQFSRHIFRGSGRAYAQDQTALDICEYGIGQNDDHNLSLFERVFYYFPLLHAENNGIQERSVMAYDSLSRMALPETKGVFDNFFKFSAYHYEVIKKFGRFPHRNQWVGRASSDEELAFLERNEAIAKPADPKDKKP